MSPSRIVFASALLTLGFAVSAKASLVISSAATHNVACAGGVCTATKRGATLNAGELAAMLASGDVKVVTGSKGHDLAVTAPVTWASEHKLTLDSYSGVLVRQPIMAQGRSGVTITLEGQAFGDLVFAGAGRIAFWDTASTLTVGNTTFTLVNSIPALASAVAANPNGIYALANDYDAAADGTYHTAAIVTGNVFAQGEISGMGNAIRNLKIRGKQNNQKLGLFDTYHGEIRDLRLERVSIKGKDNSMVGAVAGEMDGYIVEVAVSGHVSAGTNSQVGALLGKMSGGEIIFASTSGSVSGEGDGGELGYVGGLVGDMESGQAELSFSTADVTGGTGWTAGGLFGVIESYAYDDYATGVVRAGDNGTAGGAIGIHGGFGQLYDIYATGFVGGGVNSTVGGLAGTNYLSIYSSYSTGAVASGSGNAVGGFVGNDAGEPDLGGDYWDIETSGQSHGAGNDTADTGIAGLTTAQFLAGIPSGLQDGHWSQDPKINGGFPYLTALPPK